jgi:hypothetical protein
VGFNKFPDFSVCEINTLHHMKKLLIFMLFGGLALSGCQKEKRERFSAKIRVVSESGLPIQNAAIRIDTDLPEANGLEFYMTTDISGYVYFTYPYRATFDVTATKGFGWIGCSYVALQPNQEVEVEIVMYPYFATFNGCR